MMLFVLKKHWQDLAIAECKATALNKWWKDKTAAIDGTLLLASRKKVKKLALTRFVVKVLAQCNAKHIQETLAAIPLTALQGKSYRVVRTIASSTTELPSERELASIVWSRLQNPNVNLKNPQVTLDIVVVKDKAYIGIRTWESLEKFEDRRAHLRPELHPSSLHPTLARALVNITCAKSIHDPCCGSGGILIEAGLAGIRTSGADIDPGMVLRARRNCQSYGLHPDVRIADATQWLPRCGAIITDLPYGKSTRPQDLAPLCEAILLRASTATRKAIIGAPHELHFSGWIVRAKFSIYVHKSMTRHFWVLEHAR